MLEDKVHFIGALSPCDYPKLALVPISHYSGKYKNKVYYHTKMEIYDRESLVILVFDPKLQIKQRLTFNKQIDRTQSSLNTKVKRESSANLDQLKQQILQDLSARKILTARASHYLEIKDHVNGSGVRSLKVVRKKKEVLEKRLTFGKYIIFTDLLEESPEKILADYGSKQTIENDFRLLKDRFCVSLWPIYHWTDTKIRVHSFISVLALLLFKLIEYKVRSHGLQIGGKALVHELQDITEALVVYNLNEAERKICDMTRNQEEIFDVLGLKSFI